jgi:iron complex outermembrane receptor protein
MLGYTRARFGDDSVSAGVDVAGRTLPNTPALTTTLGAQWSRDVRAGIGLYTRAEAVVYGRMFYDDANTERQDAYTLTNARIGVRGKNAFAEGWIRNAFDTRYIPVAFAYRAFAPSGFVGEMGRPRTFGASLGLTF